MSFSQGTYNSQNLRNETLAIADQEYVNVSKFFFVRFKVVAKRKQLST